MKQFVTVNKDELKDLIVRLTIKDMKEILEYCHEFLTEQNFDYLPDFVLGLFFSYNVKKQQYVDILFKLFQDNKFIQLFHNKLTSTSVSKEVYTLLVWKKVDIVGIELNDMINLGLQYDENMRYQSLEYNLENELSLIVHHAQYSWQGLIEDVVFIKNEIRDLLQLLIPLPDDYNISIVKDPIATKYSYTNEDGILNFIDTIEQMLKSNLVEFGKTNEKPLLKSLNILKSSSGIVEFYDKKLGLNATDMLTRSFSYYYWQYKGFKKTNLDSLKHFVQEQFSDNLRFFISRLFTSHLKKIRFDEYYTSQSELFDLIKYIIKAVPKDGYIDMQNIFSFCTYRNLGFHFDSKYKTSEYNLPCEILLHDGTKIPDTTYVGEQYEIIYQQPILKAVFFYLSALGLVEIFYDDPKSNCNIIAKGKEYISIWDGLKYIRFTDLGLYVLGYNKKYIPKKQDKQTKTGVKFDNYQPIITIDKKDSLNIAKFEPYTTLYDTNRYVLNSTKIFKDCKSYKALELKIDNFYKMVGKNIPDVFVKFFDQLKAQSNLVAIRTNIVTLQLQKDQRLISLFQTNKKLQEIIIKAQDYKVLLDKADLSKFTKILKDNGFFLEF
jgi:hypothetical protein